MRQYYKNDILRLARTKDSFKPIDVHFLIKNEEIIFVGHKMYGHIVFHKYFSIPCKNEEEALKLEEHYIKTLKPALNRIEQDILGVWKPGTLLVGGTSDIVNNEAIDYKEMFLEAAREKEECKPLIRTPVALTIPRNSYEKKYTNGRFIWLFNIDGVLYEGEYADSETYSLNGKIYKPRQTKGFIEV